MNQKLDIFHLLFTQQMGGLEQAYIDYSKALILCGHKVTAIAPPNAPYLSELEKLPIKIIPLRVRGFYDICAWWKLRKLLKTAKPDVVIAHNGRAIHMSSMALSRINNTCLVGISHSNNLKYSKNAERLIVLTEVMKNHFIAAGYSSEHCAVMQNMIELPNENEIQELEKIKQQKANAHPPRIGFLGRLVTEKGADILFKAVSLLKAKNILVNVIIGGTGTEEYNLRSLAINLGISGQIEFWGWISQNDKVKFFANIDVLCVPSIYEPFGLVVLEAWKYNTAIIAANSEGPNSLITHNIDGLLYEKESATALAENIEKLLFGDKILVQNMVKNARKKLAGYGIEESAVRLENIIYSLIK